MIRDFSDIRKIELINLISQCGGGVGTVDLSSVYSSGWAQELGICADMDHLVSYESVLAEKSEEASIAAEKIFDTVQQSETIYDAQLQELLQQLTERHTFIGTLESCMRSADAGVPDPERPGFDLGRIVRELQAIHSSLEKENRQVSEENASISLEMPEVTINLSGTITQGDLNVIAGIVTAETLAFTEYMARFQMQDAEIFLDKVEAAWDCGFTGKSDGSPYNQAAAIMAEAGIDASLIDASWSAQSDYGKGSVQAKAGNASAQLEASAGLFIYNEDGCFFSPSVNACVGAGVSALEISAQGRTANDSIGLYGKAQADVLNAQAQAQIGAALFNSDGQFAPEFQARVSAEANIAQLRGSAGLVIMGAEVGVSAGIGFGVGAHAEFGYTDGRFNMDVGAAVGVGVSFGLDVDVAGLMDGVSVAASEAWSAISTEFTSEWEQFTVGWDRFWNGIE